MSGKLIYLAAGGTGGHVFPAVAVAEKLAKDGWQVAFVTDRRGQQLLATAQTSLPVHQISAASPLAGENEKDHTEKDHAEKDHAEHDNTDAVYRHEVAFVLGQLAASGAPLAEEALCACVRDSADAPMVRHEAAIALGSVGSARARAALVEGCGDADRLVQESCRVALDTADYWDHWEALEARLRSA